jgi:hypothetical protein
MQIIYSGGTATLVTLMAAHRILTERPVADPDATVVATPRRYPGRGYDGGTASGLPSLADRSAPAAAESTARPQSCS